MKPSRLLAAAALAVAISAPASALVLQSVQISGASVVTDFSSIGSMSFDLDFDDPSPVRLNYLVEAGDLLGPLSFDAIVRNFTGAGFDYLSFVLDGATFDSVGTVTRAFGSSDALMGTRFVQLSFTPPEFLDVEIGDALGGAGKVDWTLSLAGVGVDDLLSIRIAPAEAPEPAVPALLALALGVAVLAGRRRL